MKSKIPARRETLKLQNYSNLAVDGELLPLTSNRLCIKAPKASTRLSLRTKTLSAWMLFQAYRFDDAVAVARQILELDRNYPQSYSQTGFALWAMGSYAEAFSYFRRQVPGRVCCADRLKGAGKPNCRNRHGSSIPCAPAKTKKVQANFHKKANRKIYLFRSKFA